MTKLTDSQRKRIDARSSGAARRDALRQSAEVDRLRQPGVRASVRIMASIPARVAARPGSAAAIVRASFAELVTPLSEAMLVAYLIGIRDERAAAKRHGIDLGPVELALYDVARRDLIARLGLSAAQLATLRRVVRGSAEQAVTLSGNALSGRLAIELASVTAEQLTVPQAVSALRKAAAKAGITNAHDYALEAIYRTQMQLALNAGRWQTLQSPALQDVIWGYEYVAIGDDRTRDEHLLMNGTRAPKDDPIWSTIWPPNGWNCRCTTVTLFEEPDGGAVDPLGGARPDDGWDFNPGQIGQLANAA